jgi:tRNA-specific 2-thiouridylase
VQGEHPLLYSDGIEASGASWIGKPPREIAAGKTLGCMVKVRYRQLIVSFDEPQRAVAPGQFAVFYDGDRCLGGAAIDRVMLAEDSLRKTG